VAAGVALHGPNLFPDHPATLRADVLAWIDAMTVLGHRLARLVSIGLGLAPGWLHQHLTRDPTVLLRIFRYPPQAAAVERWGVAEHTDYGLLTILATDGRPGLEVHAPEGWQPVPPVDDAFVVNLGDMLEAMTGGRYRSTPHRVRHVEPAPASTGAHRSSDRLSFPFFFDPGWDAPIRPVDGMNVGEPAPSRPRWDGASVDDWSGTYGDYLIAKVGKVFPDLAAGVGVEAPSDRA
jgi:isopenicillin N synthase-like dioxygenase